MPIITAYPTSIVSSGDWVTVQNCFTDNTVYTNCMNTSKNTLYYFTVNGFGLSIPSGATINSITLTVQYKLSTTASAGTMYLGALKSGVLSGTEVSSSAEATTDMTLTNTTVGSWTPAELSNIQVQVGYKRTSNTAVNTLVDYVSVTVDYTESTPAYTGTVSVSETSSISSESTRSSSGSALVSSVTSVVTAEYKSITDSVTIQETTTVSVTGGAITAYTGTASVQETSSVDTIGKKLGRSPPLAVSHINSVSGIGYKALKSSCAITTTDSVSANLKKGSTNTFVVVGSDSVVSVGQKKINASVTISETQVVNISSSASTSASGLVTISETSSITTVGIAMIKLSGQATIASSDLISVSAVKKCKTTVEVKNSISIMSFGKKLINVVLGIFGQIAKSLSGSKKSIGTGLIVATSTVEISSMRNANAMTRSVTVNVMMSTREFVVKSKPIISIIARSQSCRYCHIRTGTIRGGRP